VHYTTDRRDTVRAQWETLKAAHPGLWDDAEAETEAEEDADAP
jgi:hypothetical protein